MNGSLVLKGYASLFGVPDLIGDIVRAGAFSRILRAAPLFPLLIEHDARLLAGQWDDVQEDRIGLFVRGRIIDTNPAAGLARRRIQSGVDGLSIGFRTVRARSRAGGGRDLLDVDLVEISLVRSPMLPAARFTLQPSSTAKMETIA